MPNLEQAFKRFPVLVETGIRQVVNGPFVFSPDGLPLIGPMPGQRNHFAAAAFLAGLNMGGGFGEHVAEWMVEGRTRFDLASCDVARFGDWAAGHFATERAKDTYSHRYQLHYPFDERDAGRPVRSFPLYDRHKALDAVMGPVNGWERPLWYARAQDARHDIYSFGRQNWFDAVSEEVLAVRSAVGIMDASTFAKYLVEGPRAAEWLDRMVANTLPTKIGRARLVHMCNEVGGIVAEFTATLVAPDRYLLVGASAAQQIHLRWMEARPLDGCTVGVATVDWGVIAVQGPQSRALLKRLTSADLSTPAYPYLSAQTIEVAGVSCLAMRVSFVGELGSELYCAPDDLITLWDALMMQGADLGVRPFGGRALDWLRLEKGYPRYGSEISQEVTPYEVGLGWAVKLDKGNFMGREALASMAGKPSVRYRLRLLSVDDAGKGDPIGQETILTATGKVAGNVTSGGFGPTTDQSLAMALLYPGFDDGSQQLVIDQMGTLVAARILDEVPVDPDGRKLRS